jgi:hypothetical protein
MSRWRSGGGRPATQRDIAEAKERDEIARTQLPIIRQAATNWRNGVGLGGVLVLAVPAMTGHDAVKLLSAQEKYNSAWLLGLGALLAFISLALAMYASFGWPTRAKIGVTGGLLEWQDRAVRAATWCLTISMILAVAALVAIGAGIAVMVFQVPWLWNFPGWT